MIDVDDLLGAKRADLERLARYLGIRTWLDDDQNDLALRVMRALRRIRGEA